MIVALVSAGAEWRAVRTNFPGAVIRTSPYGEWFEGCLGSGESQVPVIFLHGGWGKIAAAGSAQYAIDRWSPELLVNLGTCGGFEGLVERGTILLAERTLVYDIIEQMGDPEAAIQHYATPIDLAWLGDCLPEGVKRSLLVSGDRDLVAEEIPQLIARYGAIAGDWESGAIAYVAVRNDVRCLILRGVSDLVGSGGGEAYGKMDVFVENTNRIMASLLAMLPGMIQNRRM